MYVCVCVCVCVCMYVCIYVYMYIRMYACMHVCVYMRMVSMKFFLGTALHAACRGVPSLEMAMVLKPSCFQSATVVSCRGMGEEGETRKNTRKQKRWGESRHLEKVEGENRTEEMVLFRGMRKKGGKVEGKWRESGGKVVGKWRK
jgi:hypothetical protein